MNRLLSLVLLLTVMVCCSAPMLGSTTARASDAREQAAFISESDMQAGLLQMLARFTTYMKNDFQPCVEPNSEGEECGCFRGENTMGADERGVRPNADLSMICAFLVKYGKSTETPSLFSPPFGGGVGGGAYLPDGVSWADLEDMAMKSLIFAYSTHKANRLKVCAGGRYWGSTSKDDAVWESSLWAMSVAYSAFFQWDRLTEKQRGYVYELLKAECNYELERGIPTRFEGDTKAEENGWEADVLAATLGLFPDDPLAPQWFERMRDFAVNSYSHRNDATDSTVIDPDYNTKTVAELFRGHNLYDDYTLQNHNYFHTSYQNVVIQELGEAALALKLFQSSLHGRERWRSNALMHNCQKVMDEVLYWLALSDGELAMPNGNDWSLFLYDQITSYTTSACFLRDPHALMLENLAYRQIRSRQATTPDGSWLLRPDVGARRMGVQAHRVMMTWLMHHVLSTADLTPTTWPDFNRQYEAAKVLPSQNIVRASTDHRFTCFSWSKGLKSYTGYISPHGVGPNLIVPFRQNNTGNFLGWYDVEGRRTNAEPVVSGKYQLDGNAWVMNGELQTNDSALNHRFAIWSTPGNAVIYHDLVRANEPCTITAERGGLMAISVDEMTQTERTLYNSDGHRRLNGSTLTTMPGPWVNVDNALGITILHHQPSTLIPSPLPTGVGHIAFGETANNNSIMTAKLFVSYSDRRRTVAKGETVDRRSMVYYTSITADETSRLATICKQLPATTGWTATMTADTDSARYLLLSNFGGAAECRLQNIVCSAGKPVFAVRTTIGKEGSTATFTAEENTSAASVVRFFIEGSNVEAWQAEGDPDTIYLRNTKKGKNRITVNIFSNGKRTSKKIKLGKKLLTLNS